ncbi:hypothetical protein CcCBS67573_g09562 [Chytriomyces confervae]|uniref:Zn(2)-C6 fungal-type domain-containing protein n=1 Tax=Chytriomyces confervae TaxID=246404 RepID=A0A507DS59_9FUNG|nr:hypothetical protein CcCBS67573_g09562 [Chytriomyces confervae]
MEQHKQRRTPACAGCRLVRKRCIIPAENDSDSNSPANDPSTPTTTRPCTRCLTLKIPCIPSVRPTRQLPTSLKGVSAGQKVCLLCRSDRKKCDKLRPTCGRCSQLRVRCVYAPKDLPLQNPDSTTDAAIHSRTHSDSPQQSHFDLHVSSHGNRLPQSHIPAEFQEYIPPPSYTLSQIINVASNMPFADEEVAGGMDLDRQDRIPAYGEYEMLVAVVCGHPLLFRNSFLMFDPFLLMESYFREPPALRYAFICVCAQLLQLPKLVRLDYYNRARKAIFKDLKPAVKSVQALYYVATFALLNGQVAMAFPAMERAVHMAMLLQLEYDPDDIEPLHDIMTEKEKDEWRRTFWVFNYARKTMRLDGGPDVHVFTAQGVKPCRDFGDLMSGPLDSNSIGSPFHVCGLVDVMQEILDFVRTPPSALMDLVGNSRIKVELLGTKLDTWHAQVPTRLLIDPPTLTWTCLNHSERAGMIVLFMYHRAAVCNLHRPTLYLTATSTFKTPTASKHCQHIRSSIHTSLKNAVEIWSVCSQIVALTSLDPSAHEIHAPCAGTTAQPYLKQDVPTTTEKSSFPFPVPSITPVFPTGAPGTTSSSSTVVTQLSSIFWQENFGLCMGLYEAAVVFWFVLCRMGKAWWTNAAISGHPARSGVGESVSPLRRQYYECIQDLARALRLFETVMGEGELRSDARAPTPNMMTPLVDCIEAMLAEISQQDDFAANEATTSSVHSASVNSLVFEMQVLSLETTVPVDVVHQNRSPWVLLGLLGIDVGGKFRWGAAYEAAWKQFWKNEG